MKPWGLGERRVEIIPEAARLPTLEIPLMGIYPKEVNRQKKKMCTGALSILTK